MILDTDIGTDDAVALVLALRTPGVSVECITTVAGNTDVDSCVRNARYVLEVCGTAVPVYRGAPQPLVRPRIARSSGHADDGLGGFGFSPRQPRPTDGDAVVALISRARARPGALTLVTLGPLTNVARALQMAPDFPSLLKSTVVMGGAINAPGTVTPAAEFNIWTDPEAAAIVFGSDMPITLADISLSRGDCALDAVEVAGCADIGTAPAHLVAAMCAAYSRSRAGLPDAIATAVAIAPEAVTYRAACRVQIDTSDSDRRGETRIDETSLGAQPVRLVESVDAGGYKKLLFAACG